MWIKFANLCRKSGRLTLCLKTLNSLMIEDTKEPKTFDVATNPPQLVYAYLKHAWSSGERDLAFNKMRNFGTNLLNQLGFRSLGEISFQMNYGFAENGQGSVTRLLARACHKLGEWQMSLNDDLDEVKATDFHNVRLTVTNLIFSDRYLKFSNRTRQPPSSTRIGTRPGTRGLYVILKFWHTTRSNTRLFHPKSFLLTSFPLFKVCCFCCFFSKNQNSPCLFRILPLHFPIKG